MPARTGFSCTGGSSPAKLAVRRTLTACALEHEALQQLEGADDVRDTDLLVLLVGVAAHAWAEVDGVQPLSAELGHRRPGLLGFDGQIAEPLQSVDQRVVHGGPSGRGVADDAQ